MLAAYAAGVALNGFLPANLGTVVMLLMFVAMISGATLAGVLGGMVVQKIFFTVAGTFVYLYLFLSVAGSFELQLNLFHDHPGLAALVLGGGAFLVVLLGRVFWGSSKASGSRLSRAARSFRARATTSSRSCCPRSGVARKARRDGDLPGRVRDPGHLPHDHVGDRWKLARQHRLGDAGRRRHQPGGQSAAPRGCHRRGHCDCAYSLGQQLAITAFNIAFATLLVVWAFGWTGGKLLVRQSYDDAKLKVFGAEGAAGSQERGGALGLMASYGEHVAWHPERPRFRPLRVVIAWLSTAAALWVAAAILPGVDIAGFWGALAVAVVVAF